MKHHNTKEYRHMREVVLWIHDYTCFLCLERNLKCETHHCDKVNTNNAITNLVPVCSPCHRLVHMVNDKVVITPSEIKELITMRINKMFP
jgi:hypothetical protein